MSILGRALFENDYYDNNRDFYRRRMQQIGGEVLSGDHSFKSPKASFVGGERQLYSIYTISNEFSQVGSGRLSAGVFWGPIADTLLLFFGALRLYRSGAFTPRGTRRSCPCSKACVYDSRS